MTLEDDMRDLRSAMRKLAWSVLDQFGRDVRNVGRSIQGAADRWFGEKETP